ncbi:acetyltransferase [Lentilitoribacter sp. EG35]|uniref:acetyltransferase n=1 Tax=Lentilitoribacter sp. EG35 TaxID=3234192 RepID=UPI0034606CD7
MIKVLLVGGGGHCKSCIDVIEAENQYEIVGFLNTQTNESINVLGYPHLGTDDDLGVLKQDYASALVAVGQIKSPNLRIKLYSQLKELGFSLPIVKSPLAYASRYSTIGSGTIIMHNALINASSKIGENCIINSQALIEHDVTVGDHCHISTGAKLNGGVRVGSGTFIGSGSVISSRVEIGGNCVIGAGMTIKHNIPSQTVIKN